MKWNSGKDLKKLGKSGCVLFALMGHWNWKNISFWNVMFSGTSETVMAIGYHTFLGIVFSVMGLLRLGQLIINFSKEMIELQKMKSMKLMV